MFEANSDHAKLPSRSQMTKLIVFDLDETLWSLSDGYCALMKPPFTRHGDQVSDTSGLLLTLRADARETLDILQKQGFLLSVASRTTPETGGAVLDLLGMLDYFTCPCFAWQDKDLSLKRVFEDLDREKGIRISPGEALFIDDWPSNIRDARKLGVSGLVFGHDIQSLSEILKHVNGSGDKHAIRSL